MLSAPINEYPKFPLALSEAHNIPTEIVIRHLQNRTDRLDEQVTELDELITIVSRQEIPEAYWFVADYLRTVQVAERDWIRTLIQRLETKELPWPSENKTK